MQPAQAGGTSECVLCVKDKYREETDGSGRAGFGARTAGYGGVQGYEVQHRGQSVMLRQLCVVRVGVPG